MKVVGLVSGGKDSCFAMMKCLQYGHQIVALANLLPADDAVDELDSYMYQTVGHQIVVSYAKCMGVPLFRRRIQGSTRHHDLSYNVTPGDEVEDMFILLNEVKKRIPSLTAVSSGAIASDYQRLRVESVCSRLGLVSLAYLWKLDQSLLLQEMIETGIVAIIVKVAAIGLDPKKHLGKELSTLKSHLLKLKEMYGSNVCGEGGEYETLTLDCPLFENARLVLDEFEVVLHSSDSIAPVGVLHPLAFHSEYKPKYVNGVRLEEIDLVVEVPGDCLKVCKEKDRHSDVAIDLAEVKEPKIHISKTRKDNTFSMCSWLQDSNRSSADLQGDLKVVLMKIESQLMEFGFSWENVLYIHLYIADMNKFATANETYVKFITQEKCRFGVPSRSTIELPLLQVGLGRAYIEVLVANDKSKRVLHVQSISCWAPSCIGPYSQATLHKEILHMAGQLGLDPPTMLLSSGGPTAELEQALENSEAVAKSFNCSISTSAILFVIYCSTSIPASERTNVQDKLDAFLKQMKVLHSDNGNHFWVLDPIFLYILVPDLPKRALVEVKPILFVEDNVETVDIETDHVMPDRSSEVATCYWNFQYEHWHDLCLQKCIVHRKICAIILSITDGVAVRICADESTSANEDALGSRSFFAEGQMMKIARFCLYQLDKILLQNCFAWDDVLNLRLYFPTSLHMSHECLSLIFTNVFKEFAEMSQRLKFCEVPIFNLIPVVGAGRSATSIDDIITCELFARKS